MRHDSDLAAIAVDPLAQEAVQLAADLLAAANAQQTEAERSQAQKIARMMEDPAGKDLTIALIDQAFRSRRPARIADQLAYLLDRYGAPSYMDWWERVALAVGGVMGHYLPGLVVPAIMARLRQETRYVILPAEEEELHDYLAQRRQSGVRLNLNLLGEAILGEAEAQRRLDGYLALLAREEIEYISVKISSMCSQLNHVAFDQTLTTVKERLRLLYRQALAYHYRHPDGRVTPKFVNLDMEEYRDLHLTVAAFQEVLDEPEFAGLSAGLALQAYLPDSHPIQQQLTAWAMERRQRGGAAIKLRIVKGANLAMERVEASLRGWPQAPYTSKAEVDANFKRMVAYGCLPAHAQAVHLGIGSHNLFDVAYALLLRRAHGVEPYVEFEMLEGMANHQARAVQAQAGGLLLYAPVVKAEDFHSAIAYLVRRLDENTAPANFLHDLFGLEPGSPAWDKQRDQFLEAVAQQGRVYTGPRRSQDRRSEQPEPAYHTPFANEPDTDWSLPANCAWIGEVMERWRQAAPEPIPLQIDGQELYTDQTAGQTVDGVDPSRPGVVAYRHSVAGPAQVEQALSAAVAAQPTWAAQPVAERRRLLLQAAAELARRRGDLIGAMTVDGAKTVAEADPEVSEAVDFARYYAHALDLGDETAGCRLEPLGVVVVTPPWNFPLSIPAGGVLAALMAGNAVILKPAPEAVLVAWHLAQALWAAGIPKRVLQFVPAPDNEVGQALITGPRTAGVILTGSIETARLFLGWRPDLRLFAETSGKNSLIITAMAGRDQAIKDLVRSAFGHNGQKCSAASLAICEAEVYDDPIFLRQLQDAAASLPVGSAWDAMSAITPLSQPPSDKLRRALESLEPGESWLLEPKPLAVKGHSGAPRLWSPGIKLGVQPGSFFHQTECFGPVLGLMRARDLEEAIEFANGTPFGLTGGIHTLDERERARYQEQIEVGNVYINRPITGAIVQRQPFGGWKASNVGSSAKAGGPNYVLQLGVWREEGLPTLLAEPAPAAAELLARCLRQIEGEADQARLRTSAGSYAWAWQTHFGRAHDPSQVLGEQNLFRYRSCRRVLLRVDPGASRVAVAQVLLAAATASAPLEVSAAPEADWAWLQALGYPMSEEDESRFLARLQTGQFERLRLLAPPSVALRELANRLAVHVVDAPVLANGRLELRHYLREQAVSHTVHRYGNLPGGVE